MSSPGPAPAASPAQPDPFDLARFVAAQETSFDRACVELAAGRKQSHWIWYIMPQMRGLGRSDLADRYGIASLAEAEAYLADPLLGPRLRLVVGLILAIEGRTALEIMGSPDDLKLHSSMTLFARATADNAAFRSVIDRYFGGREDEATLRLLGLD